MSVFKPKTKILFPNRWAADSFLLKLKRSSGWTYQSSDGGKYVRIQPQIGSDYILIGLLQSRAGVELTIDSEKLSRGAGQDMERLWTKMFDYARLYRS
jgi:hypothetical protein